MQKKDYARAETAYLDCARKNDSEAQYQLGILYKDGLTAPKDNEKALAFFRFAAENGYAPAQRELAKLLIELERTPEGEKVIQAYLKKALPTQGNSSILGNLKRTDTAAYTWLLLAAEKAENKWYYPSPALSDEAALAMIQDKNTGKASRAAALSEASAWKMKKLNQAAKAVLSEQEFSEFQRRLQEGTAAEKNEVMRFLQYKITGK